MNFFDGINMRFSLPKFIVYGLSGAALLVAADALHLYFAARKNHIAQRPIHEVLFVMSDGLPCCKHTESKKIVQKCKNPHCKAKLSHKIIEHIDSAKHLICLALYMFTMRQISEAIANAVQRGVKIRMIVDYSMIATSGSQINRLQEKGVAVRVAGNGDKYMHHKFCLVDVLENESGEVENSHPVKGVLINGSMNWTANGFDRNWENVFFTSDDLFKSEYKKSFDYMWSRLEKPTNDFTKESKNFFDKGTVRNKRGK